MDEDSISAHAGGRPAVRPIKRDFNRRQKETTHASHKLSLFIHLVWATWDRLPLVTPEIERRVCRNAESEAIGKGCQVLAINGIPDHVHLVVTIPSTVAIADLVKQVKGVSSHFMNETLKPEAV